MFRYVALAAACLCAPACGPTAVTTSAPERAPVPVHWLTLVRDYATAEKYANVPVSVALRPDDYECSGGEVRVWYNDRLVPPVLVFRFRAPAPVTGPVTVVGTCRAPVRDGKVRARLIDFSVTVDDCVVSR